MMIGLVEEAKRRLAADDMRAPGGRVGTVNDLTQWGLVHHLVAAAEQRDSLLEALTPSGGTKAAYHGEFKFQVTQWRENEDPDSDEEMEEYLADFTVPWTTVKEIMAAILARASA